MIKHIAPMDYSALEQRIRAIEEEKGPHLFEPKSALLDLHTITTAIYLGVMYSEVTKKQRSRIGKALNFGAMYSPCTQWHTPPKEQLLAIWTEHEQAQLYTVLGIQRGQQDLYEALAFHFAKTYGIKA